MSQKEAIGPYLTTQMHALSSFIFCLQAVAYLSYIASSLFAILNPQQKLFLVLFFGLKLEFFFDFPVVWCLVSVHASQSNVRKRCPATKIQNWPSVYWSPWWIFYNINSNFFNAINLMETLVFFFVGLYMVAIKRTLILADFFCEIKTVALTLAS